MKFGDRVFGVRLLVASLVVALLAAPPGAGAQTPEESATPVVDVTTTPTPTALAEATATPTPSTTAPAATATATATPTATPLPGCEPDASDPEEADGASIEALINTLFVGADYAGGPNNMVKLKNKVSDRLRVKGNVQINKIGDDTVTPFNYALAYNACGANVQTLAVALQLNVYQQGAHNVSPQNFAVGVNYGCNRCAAIAYAVQFSYGVADPNEVPAELQQLARDLDAELRAVHSEAATLTLRDAHARVVAVIDRFRGLPATILEKQDELIPQ